MPIRVYVLPMARHACPARLPEHGRTDWGDVQVSARLSWIKPWEIDARVVLDHNSPRLDPWAILFRLTNVQKDEVINRVKNRPEEAGLFRILGGMRYRRNVGDWRELVGRLNQMISREMMRESLAVQEWLQEGRQEGREEGREKGREEGKLAEARSALLMVIESRFPGLRVRDAVESISDLDVLHSLITVVAKVRTAAAVLRAIPGTR